jgi:hypothetical protein
MTTTSATWFYRQPEKNKYLLEERVRGSFWEARLGSFWADAESIDTPITMTGAYSDTALRLEWEPGQWFRLTAASDLPGMVIGVSNVIRRPVTLHYTDAQGQQVWEWWLEHADQRWQALQGKPMYSNLQRLDRAN